MMRKKCKGLRTKEIHLCLKMRCSDVCVARKRRKTGKEEGEKERGREERRNQEGVLFGGRQCNTLYAFVIS